MLVSQVYIPFDQLPLADLVSGNPLESDGATPTLTPAVFNNGLQFDGQSTLTVSTFNVQVSAFTFGFWLQPVNPGVVTDPFTLATLPLVMPVFSKGYFSFGNPNVTVTQAQFSVWEETQVDGTNVMKAKVYGATSAIAVSVPYTTNAFHYFWIVYNGSGQTIQIYVDFLLSPNSISGQVPLILNVTAAPLAFNDAAEVPTFQIARNAGVIDDFVGFNSAQSATAMNRAGQYGAIFVADSNYATTEQIDQILSFNDSTTVQITAMASSRGNLFVSRTDGLLQKGEKTVWESRHDFSDSNDVSSLTFTASDGTTNLASENGTLHLNNEIVNL
jgi:hypothetical protein